MPAFTCQLRTTNVIERLHGEFRRRVKTQDLSLAP